MNFDFKPINKTLICKERLGLEKIVKTKIIIIVGGLCVVFLSVLIFSLVLGKNGYGYSKKRTLLILLAPDGSYIQKADISLDHGTLWKREGSNTRATVWEVEPEHGQATVHIHTEGEDFLIGNYDGPMTNEIRLHLRRDSSAGITGNVFDEHGIPISGAEITVEGYNQKTVSNAQGWFNLDIHAAKGERVIIVVRKEGYQTYSAEQFAGIGTARIMMRQ